MRNERDYKKDYEMFWKGIVENEDGTLNKDQVMRELSDYSMVMDNCSMAYSTMTKQRISKQNTHFFEVEGIFNELYLDNDIVVDDIVEILKEDDINELKSQLKNYFGIIDESKGE